jgi:acid phosphatase class B
MKNIQKIIMSVFLFTFVIQTYSQDINKKLKNKTYMSRIGSICQETTIPDPCAGQEIFLVLNFQKGNIKITEKYISSCGVEEISYELIYKWELTNNNEIKIFFNPKEVEYKSIENMKFKIDNEIIIGYKRDWNDKNVEYVFTNSK